MQTKTKTPFSGEFLPPLYTILMIIFSITGLTLTGLSCLLCWLIIYHCYSPQPAKNIANVIERNNFLCYNVTSGNISSVVVNIQFDIREALNNKKIKSKDSTLIMFKKIILICELFCVSCEIVHYSPDWGLPP